ncbi:MAG: peptidoglycan DD-metalloendopeptidase family protein [Gammaproteobacteria bacterium]|nr:peptidoglycan DD-metalloendopeptidase family protein [Gammaproteobacteria bacterium]
MFYKLLILLLLPAFTLANELPTASAVPGGIAIIPLAAEQAGKPHVRYIKRKVMVIKNDDQSWSAVIGLPLSIKPGTHHLSVQWPNKKTNQRIAFEVKPYEYESQYLTIKNKRKVNPYKNDMQRIKKERRRSGKAKFQWSHQTPHFDFIRPVSGPESSQFGLRRFFNKQPRRPHGGLDIAAAEGTPIYAPADGKVVEAGNFFFNGNCVFLEHGQGLISFYAHMNKIKVKIGDTVKQGEQIGEVGQTGRVTGPHLHWSVGLNGTWINPKLFLAADDQTAKSAPKH